MEYKMRRTRQLLSAEETDEVLKRATSGVLAIAGDDDYPYAVPISYVYDGEKIYFHSALQGHKLDAIRRNPKVSFCVIEKDTVVPEEFTTYFRSAIVFGTMRILEDESEKLAAMRKLAARYSPGETEERREEEIRSEWNSFCMLELTVEKCTGKEAIELVREKEKTVKQGN